MAAMLLILYLGHLDCQDVKAVCGLRLLYEQILSTRLSSYRVTLEPTGFS